MKYDDYLKSEHWKETRARMLKAAYSEQDGGYNCRRCGGWFGRRLMEVHHYHYRTLGRETDADLDVVCRACHAAIHHKEPPAEVMVEEMRLPPRSCSDRDMNDRRNETIGKLAELELGEEPADA